MSLYVASVPSQVLLGTLRDSQTKKPFVEAQYVNCTLSHAFSAQTVNALFGKMQNNGLCEREGPCPECTQQVTAYYPNSALQRVVNAFFGANPAFIDAQSYPLGPTELYLEDRKKNAIELKGTTRFLLCDVNVHEEIFDDKKASRVVRKPNRIDFVSIERSGITHPDIFITIALKKSVLDDSKKLIVYYHAHGVTSLVQTQDISRLANQKPMSLEEFERFVPLLIDTNGCRQEVVVTLENELKMCQLTK